MNISDVKEAKKKKQWIGWVSFERDEPFTTYDQNGNPLTEVYHKRKDVSYGYRGVRKVKIEEV